MVHVRAILFWYIGTYAYCRFVSENNYCVHVLFLYIDDIDDHTLLWLLNQIRLGLPQIIVHIRHHKHIRGFAFFITTTFEK